MFFWLFYGLGIELIVFKTLNLKRWQKLLEIWISKQFIKQYYL